jgi:hypothetical protein
MRAGTVLRTVFAQGVERRFNGSGSWNTHSAVTLGSAPDWADQLRIGSSESTSAGKDMTCGTKFGRRNLDSWQPYALVIEPADVVVGGMCGSPLISTSGAAIGVISTGNLTACLTNGLPVASGLIAVTQRTLFQIQHAGMGKAGKAAADDFPPHKCESTLAMAGRASNRGSPHGIDSK